MKRVLMLLGLLLSSPALGCECLHGVLDEETAGAAKNVFIFELQETRLKPLPAGDPADSRPYEAMGRIRVLQTLRGRADAFTQIEYNISHCCGMRLGLGERYVAFVDETGPVLHANGGNVLAPGPLFEHVIGTLPPDPYLFEISRSRLHMQ